MFAAPTLAHTAAIPAPQRLPEGAPTQSAWGNFGGFVNSALGNAMDLYAQYEGVQAMKNAAGVARKEQSQTAELENGAAVVVDATKAQQPAYTKPAETMVFGFPQKQVITAFAGLLVVGVLLKVAKS
jgi:hypothetical protein